MSESKIQTSADSGSVRKVGKAGDWVSSQNDLTKLTQEISSYISVAKVRTKFLAANGGKDELPEALKDSRIQSISTEKRQGLREASFCETVRALAPLYPEFFWSRRYRDVADNPDALTEVGNDFIIPAQNVEAFQSIKRPSTVLSRGIAQSLGIVISSVAIGLVCGWTSRYLTETNLPAIESPDTSNEQLLPANIPKDRQFLSDYLGCVDPTIFYGAKDGIYDAARLNVNKQAEFSETVFATDIAGATASFDIMSNNAAMVKEIMFPIMEEGIQRGVRYRIVLSDYSTSNKWNDLFRETTGYQHPEATRVPSHDTHQKLADFIHRIETDKINNPNSKFTGSLEVRWNPRFLFNTMWIRDYGQTNAIAHLGMHFYRGKETWPSLRVSPSISPDMVDTIAQEFRYAFDNGIPFEDLPIELTSAQHDQ